MSSGYFPLANIITISQVFWPSGLQMSVMEIFRYFFLKNGYFRSQIDFFPNCKSNDFEFQVALAIIRFGQNSNN